MSSSTAAAASSGEEAPSAIRVLVRVRPLNEREAKSKNVLQLESGETTAIDFGTKEQTSDESSSTAEGTVSILTDQQGPSSFTYDAVFGPESQQIDIFESVKGIIDAVVSGYNGTIVAYGQTSSGKTHTIFGEESDNNDEAAGLVQRSLKVIFDKMKRNDEASAANNPLLSPSSQQKHSAKASFFEIYNEKVYDLLSSNDNMLQESLPVREDSTKGVYVEGLNEHVVHNTADAMDVLRVGNDNRRVASTNMNRVSSRSHAVFVLTVKNVIMNDLDGTSKVLESKFTLVDLAGSERQKTTDAAGERLKEASMINNSLLCLGQVINSLVDRENGKERHVPFRDSKLTFLLRDSWGGNSKTCLVATVTPSATSISETVSTLKFAQRAKLIKNVAIKNETYSMEALQLEIARLKNALEQRGSNSVNSAIVAESSSSSSSSLASGAVGSNSIDRITISSLRNHNSTLNEKIKVLKDQSNLMEQQVNSLKRKLQQETMIRKCKERRITYLSSKSTDEGLETEAIANLQNEVNTLREQLESKQNSESIHWMIKYKEEKVKLDQILKSNTAALDEANDQAELCAHLESLLDAKEALEAKLASMQHGRHSELDVMSKDVAKLEKEIAALKSQLAKKEAEVQQYKAGITATKSQISSLDKDRIEALEFLETVNSELVAEQKKVVKLQASVDSMSQLLQEKENVSKDYQLREAARQDELNDAKTQLQNLRKDLDATKAENSSLIKNLNDVTNDISAKESEVAHLKSECEQALERFTLQQKEGSDKLESLQAQLTQKDEQMKSILDEKNKLEESIKNLTSQNASAAAEAEELKKSGAEWQERVSSLEDKIMCASQEKKRLEEELDSVREDIKRTISLQEESNVKTTEAHNVDLVQRDEAIELLKSEKDVLQKKLDTAESGFQEKIQILQNEIDCTKEECENVKQKEENLLSTLDTLTDGYEQIRMEKESTEKQLKETESLLKKSKSLNVELESNSKVNSSEIEAVKQECEALKKKEQQLLSDLEMATETSSQIQSEKCSLEEELIATKALLESSTSTNAQLESSNEATAAEVDTLKDEFQAAKETEQQLLSELAEMKAASSQMQLEKEAIEKDLAETKALLENSASAKEELELSNAARASEMDASIEELKNQILRLTEENEVAKVLETQVSELTRENQSHQASIAKLESSLVESESAKIELDKSAASKINEIEAVLTRIKEEHAAEIDGLNKEAESLKGEMLGKQEDAVAKMREAEAELASTKDQHAQEIQRINVETETLKTNASVAEESNAAKLKEMEGLIASIKQQHMEETEQLKSHVELVNTKASEKEDRMAAKLTEAVELAEKLTDDHAIEIEKLKKEVDALETEAIGKEEATAKKLSECETTLASLKQQHAAEIEQMEQDAAMAKTEMSDKEENAASKLKAMEVALTSLKAQHADEIESLNNEAEALKSDAINKEAISTVKLMEMEAACASLKAEHAAEIDCLKQQAEAVKVEMIDKEEISAVKLRELEEMIEKMKVQHAEDIEKMKAETLDKAVMTNATLEGDVQDDNVKDSTFDDDDDDDDFDEDMFLPNVDVQPDASEIVSNPPPASPIAEPAEETAAEAPPAVPAKVDENSPLSPSMTPFKQRRQIFVNRAEQNTADEKSSPKKPPLRRSRRNTTAPKMDQTPVQRVTRRSSRLSTSRTPFTDLQDTSSSSTRKVRTNFKSGAFD